jgi:hypothetical protein
MSEKLEVESQLNAHAGFIDVHAHWNGFASWYPARSWEHETFLAYGVTTVHKYVVPPLPCKDD